MRLALLALLAAIAGWLAPASATAAGCFAAVA
jgi:hypothetical protein